jgi:membrane-associated protease RseP (regulator of RpoE activity)
VIFIHELGHYLFAKWAGVRVQVFAIGFGPAIFKRRIGETDYQLCLLPFGGYVQMQEEPEPDLESDSARSLDDGAYGDGPDDDDAAPSSRGRSLSEASPAWKTAILLAGVVFNLVSSFIILLALSWAGMPITPATVGEIAPEIVSTGGKAVVSPAKELGLHAGDHITDVNGRRVRDFDQLQNLVVSSAGTPLAVTVERDGSSVVLSGTADNPVTSVYNSNTGIPSLGIGPPIGRRLEVAWQGGSAGQTNKGDASSVSASSQRLPAGSELIRLDGRDVSTSTGQVVRNHLLAEWPASHDWTYRLPDGTEQTVASPWFGLEALAPSDAIGLPIQVGHVQPGSPAAQAGLLAGDVFIRVNDQPIAGVLSLLSAVQKASQLDSPASIVVQRGNTVQTLSAEPRFDPVLGKAAFGLSMQPLLGVLPTVSQRLAAANIQVGQTLLAVESVQPDTTDAEATQNLADPLLAQLPQAFDVVVLPTTVEPRLLSLTAEMWRQLTFRERPSPLARIFGAQRATPPWRLLQGARIDRIDASGLAVTRWQVVDDAAHAETQPTLQPERVFISVDELGPAAEVLVRGTTPIIVGDWIVAAPVVGQEEGRALQVVAGPDLEPHVVRLERGSALSPMIFGIESQILELDSWTDAFAVAGGWTRQMIFDSMSTIARFFAPRDQGGVDHERALAGPVGIFSIFKATLDTQGWSTFLRVVALLGLNLVLINLIPIPITDGGRLVVVAAEVILRRPPPQKIVLAFNAIGFVLIVLLMVYVLGLDILRQVES